MKSPNIPGPYLFYPFKIPSSKRKKIYLSIHLLERQNYRKGEIKGKFFPSLVPTPVRSLQVCHTGTDAQKPLVGLPPTASAAAWPREAHCTCSLAPLLGPASAYLHAYWWVQQPVPQKPSRSPCHPHLWLLHMLAGAVTWSGKALRAQITIF